MQSNRPIVVGLIVAALAAAGLWFFLQGGEGSIAPPAPEQTTQHVAPAAPGAPVDAGGKPESAVVTTENAERTAVAPGRGVDESLPGFTGRVVGPDGRPIAGARVGVAPGFGPANGNGRFDLQSFDFAALEDGAFDPAAMLRSVRDQQKDRVEVETDAEGRFRVVAKGTSPAVGLRVLARGHGILDRRFDRPRAQDLDVGTLALQTAAIVAGRVLSTDGTPVVGARVGRTLEVEQRLLGGIEFEIPELAELETLRGPDTVLTDALGQFELAHVAPGELTLRARHPEHPTAKSQPLTVEAGRELRAVLLTMQNGGVIAGVVSGLPADTKGLQVMAARKPKAAPEQGGERGIAGMFGNLGVDLDAVMGEAGIGLGERTATIGADGRFEVRGLAADTWRVWVARTGSGFAGSATCSERVEAVPGSSIQLVFEPGVTVTFTVADSKSGKPVERLVVRDRLRGPGGGGVADLLGGVAAMGGMQSARPANYPNGAVTVANLRPKADQKLTLTIEAVGYATLERGNLELPAAGNLDLGALALDPVPVLAVTVVAADDGRPIAGANVRIVAGPSDGDRPGAGRRGMLREFRRFAPGVAGAGLAGGRTDRNGRIVVNRPPQGAVIEVDAQGLAPFASAALTFTAAGPDAFTARLHAGGAVAVTVCDPADKPVAGAFVEHRSPDGDVDTRKTDDQGLTRFEHLPPGAHQFRLGKDGGGLASVMSRFEGRAGGNANSAPAAEPTWQPVGRSGAGRTPRTDAQGAYELRDLPEGEHHLRIAHGSRAAPTTVRIVLRAGDNVVDVDLDTTMLRGVVKDTAGQPVVGARIRVRRPRDGGDPASEIGGIVENLAGARLGGAGGGTIQTDAAGAFEVRGVEPDVELEVSASAKGFAPVAQKVTAARGAVTTAPELVLGAAGTVRVSVAGNQPFGTVRARWIGPGDGVAPVVAVLRRGKGTLEGLRPGTWEISVESLEALGGRLGGRFGGRAVEGGQPQQPAQPPRTVEVIAGQTFDVDL
jgi:protocatechuate 3,4-dioxygenase beta subunit